MKKGLGSLIPLAILIRTVIPSLSKIENQVFIKMLPIGYRDNF